MKRSHGASGTPAYSAWRQMIQRCEWPKYHKFADYGGRGITVCERWHDYANFLADMGPRPEGMWIERKDNDQGYSPKNCCWATPKEQQRHRRNNSIVTVSGRQMTLQEASEIIGASAQSICNRTAYYKQTHQESIDQIIAGEGKRRAA